MPCAAGYTCRSRCCHRIAVTPRNLEQWLEYQQQIHKLGIDLGLDRVRTVWQRMGEPQAPINIIVGGTNGKGSTVAFLEAMLRASGARTGAYTSPHLLTYNERISIAGQPVDDAALCAAFERIESARGELTLTYFEFGTLAALDLFARRGVDVGLLEVGLGGRLDATNIIDADAAVITTVAMDHMDWLGSDRDSIGREKACIARAARPAIVGDAGPPNGLMQTLRRIGARVERIGVDFHALATDTGWRWRHVDGAVLDEPLPTLQAPCQIGNAAVAVAVLHALRDRLPWSPGAIAEGVRSARMQGRLQRLGTQPELIVDVAHNPQAAQVLAAWLRTHPVTGRTRAVFGALADKNVSGVITAFDGIIDRWHLAALDKATARGLPAAALQTMFAEAFEVMPSTQLHEDVPAALQAARGDASPSDRIVVFGSFFAVSPVLGVA